MVEHTKEPWEVQPYVEEGSVYIIGSNLGGLVAGAHSWSIEIDSGDTTRVKANARRIVECVNAMQGITDPAALVASYRQLVEALEPFCDFEEVEYSPGIMLEINDFRDDDGKSFFANAREALATARAVMGEA